jgi:DNA invertase Pin-like site-specific DNA recombinase
MKIGYARVSTFKQDVDVQVASLRAAGCDQILEETKSGGRRRPVLEKVMAMLQPGDTLVVYKLDRLGRDMMHLFEIMQEIERRDIQFWSLTENIDRGTPQGKLIFGIMAVFAEFERERIRERTAEKLAFRRANGIRIGRKSHPATEAVRELIVAGGREQEVIAKTGIGRRTFYKIKKLCATDTQG